MRTRTMRSPVHARLRRALRRAALSFVLLGPAWAVAETPDEARERLSSHVEAFPHDADGLLNLGLAEARAGRLAEAMLAFERARLRAPMDREIEDVLAAARAETRRQRASEHSSGTITEGEPAALSWWRFFRALPPSWAPLGLWVFAWLWTVLVFARRRTHEASTARDLLTVGAVLTALAALTCLSYAAGRSWTGERLVAAVVTADAPRARSAPDELAPLSSERNLYAGAVVRVTERRGAWVEIELADGDRVWVSPDVVQAIDRPE